MSKEYTSLLTFGSAGFSTSNTALLDLLPDQDFVNKSSIKKTKELKVYCVVTIFTGMRIEGERVSQWYSRASDAKRKSKKLNGGLTWTKAVSFTLSQMKDIP